MFYGMDPGRSGIVTYGDQITIIANNIANLQTNAFKSSSPTFDDMLYQVFQPLGRVANGGTNPLGVSLGTGVRTGPVFTNFQSGPAVQTDEPLDLRIADAQNINGPSFFQVRDAKGNIFYTRLGSFLPKGDGASGLINLPLSTGVYTLFPPILLPGNPGTPQVNSNGVVSQGGVDVGQIVLVHFRNPDGLLQKGDLLFQATADAGTPLQVLPNQQGIGPIVQGQLEGTNVELAPQLADLLQAGQAISFNSSSFDAGNRMILTTYELARRF